MHVKGADAAARQRLGQTKATPKGAAKAEPTIKGGGATLQAYTVEQVAKMLHISRDKVYYLLRTRQLRSIKSGKSRRITDRHLADFIASLEDHVA
jgi:excisionase family DNA binding protein